MTYIFAGAFARYDPALAASLRRALPTAAIRRFTSVDVPPLIPHDFCPRTWAPPEGLLGIAWPTKYTSDSDGSLPDDADGSEAFALICSAVVLCSARHTSVTMIALHVECWGGQCGCTVQHLLAGLELARHTYTPDNYSTGLTNALSMLDVSLGPHGCFPPLSRGAFAELGESCDH